MMDDFPQELRQLRPIVCLEDLAAAARDAAAEVRDHTINREKFDCAPPIIIRVALTAEQIANFGLPTRPTKKEGNQHAKHFEGDSVELDALPASELRNLICACIEQHITQEALHALRTAEESEREIIERWAAAIASSAP